MKQIVIIWILLFIFTLQFSCEKKAELLAPHDQETKLELMLTGLGNLGSNAQYTLWAVYDSSSVEITALLGHFTTDNQGVLSQNVFEVNLGIMQRANTLVISIEEADTIPSAASVYRIIAAKLKANNGTFSIGDEYLVDFDVTQANGFYQIMKPQGSDSVKGIWFMSGETDTTREAGLELPEAPTRWTYEAYVIVGGDSFPTGIFTNPAVADGHDDYGDPNQPMPTYPFPGENFQIDPETGNNLNLDLRGAEVLVKIMPPIPAYAHKPFTLEIFKGTIPNDADINTTYQLTNNGNTFPSGTAILIIKLFE
jgi:hypothetical protein